MQIENRRIMKGIGVLLCVLWLLMVLPVEAQQYIGCRVGDQWVETPMLRKSIYIEANDLQKTKYKKFRFNFRAIVNSLGYHELYVNGVKVGDRVLQPAVSQLDKSSLAEAYDITSYLHEGDNELLIWLGQGWGRVYGTPAAVYVVVLGEMYDSVKTVTVTDSTWEASPSGYSYTGSWQPLRFGGERFDARVKPDWRPATVYEKKGSSKEQQFEGNRIIDTLTPASVARVNDSTLLLDFGRVLTGWFQAEFLPMAAGHEVAMEYLDHPKAVPPHTESDFYIARGDGREFFTNRFHYHAFRYVRITGAEFKEAKALQISALDPNEAATFECSDSRLNAVHDHVKYTLQCLTLSGYMVDCPHLERMGYGGDGNSSTMTLQTIWNVKDTYHNWLMAWEDAMDSVGDLPYVAPAFRTGGGPYWSGFVIKAPWRTYLNYGDWGLPFIDNSYYYTRIMKRWLNFIKRHSVDEILQPWPDTERHTWFLGDWSAPEGVDIGGESVLHATSCFLSECLDDMAQLAKLLEYYNDTLVFKEWQQRLKASIHRHFYHPETHTYGNGTPLDQCYALLQNIPPDSATRAAVRERLLTDCHEKYNDHIAVGLMGVPIFTEWCIQERQADLMATILRQPDYPGYLHMINHGATTTWESWGCERDNGEDIKEDRSRVHNCYNGIGIWFYQALAGIRLDPEKPGYEHFFIDPQPVEGVDWVRATKPTQYGTIRVEINYKTDSDSSKELIKSTNQQINESTLKLSVPEGTTATVFPGTEREQTLGAGEWELEMK